MRSARISLALAIFAVSLTTGWGQPETAPKKRLSGSAVVTGFIGGESHDGYVIHVREGQVMTVRISWKREGGNRASFSVSESPDFFSGEPVKFGKESHGGKRWTGKCPKTGDYYIDVVAHPTARYTLRVDVSPK